ncbi:MAG TPA: hypothetical protein PK765_06510 [bacterium]|nr:hypothetical protein [bacterium]
MEAAWQKPIDLSLIIADRGLTLDPVFDDDEIFFPIIERTATLYTQKASELLGRTCSVSTFSAL